VIRYNNINKCSARENLQIDEQKHMLDNLRTLVRSLKSESSPTDDSQLQAELAALHIQVHEHAESFRKERNDRVMLNEKRKRLERDCKVYRMERDEARRQAQVATAESNRASEALMDLREQMQRLTHRYNTNISPLSAASDWSVRNQRCTAATNRKQPNYYDSKTSSTTSSTRGNASSYCDSSLFVEDGGGSTLSQTDSVQSDLMATSINLISSERGSASSHRGTSSSQICTTASSKNDSTISKEQPSTSQIRVNLLQEDSLYVKEKSADSQSTEKTRVRMSSSLA